MIKNIYLELRAGTGGDEAALLLEICFVVICDIQKTITGKLKL